MIRLSNGRKRRLRWAALALSLGMMGSSSPVMASPWTLPHGTLALKVSTDFQMARSEFLIDGTYQSFPLEGRFSSENLRMGLRYGITDRVEVSLDGVFSHVSFSADEVYLGDPFATDYDELESNAQITAGILSVDRQATGLGDVRLAARYRFTDEQGILLTGELGLKLPTGYAAPAGTFSQSTTTPSDDVTLGDGQADIMPRLLIGVAPSARVFVRADLGGNIRLFGPGQQVEAALKSGVRLLPWLMVYGEVEGLHTVSEGKVIGRTWITKSPDTPAAELTPDDLTALDYRLDRSFFRPGVGAIVFGEHADLELSYSQVVWGINIARLHFLSVGTAFRW